VPAVLLSGHQANMDIWRAEQAKKNTQKKRPDLLNTPN
jgi:tRNA (guanine37-N1)-methyltransferase